MAYRILSWFLRIAVRVFFRQVEVVGLENVPDGPVLFVGNHPNSLIDPILIITTCGRRVHFAAKDTLFRGRIMRAVLKGLGAVPVARRAEIDGHDGAAAGGVVERDRADRTRINDAAFEHMFQVLGKGGAIGIFPEGLSHDQSQLAKLKTGAARLALGAAATLGHPISIVPCGLTFIHPKRFRSRVLVQYGPALSINSPNSTPGQEFSGLSGVPPSAEAAAASPASDAVKTTTGEIDKALRRLTINAPDWETVRALDAVRRLYQPQGISIEDRIELARRFNAHYAAVAAEPKIRSLMARVQSYQEKLDELGISDRELARDLSKLEVAARMMRHLVLVMWWLPLCVPGAPLHIPTAALARVAGSRLTPRKDVIATTKLLIGMGLVMLSYALAVAVLWMRMGAWWGIGAALVLPLSGWATLRVLDRLRFVRRTLGVLARRVRFRREVQALRVEREALSLDVIRTVGEVLPKDVQPLFPHRIAPGVAADVVRATRESEHRHDADLDAEFDKDAIEAELRGAVRSEATPEPGTK